MRHRLFIKIYGAFLGIVVLCIVAAGVGSHLLRDAGPIPPHMHEVAEVFVEDLPDDSEGLQATIEDRAERLGVTLGLFGADRELIASSGEVPAPRQWDRDHLIPGPGGPAAAVALRDGRWLVTAPGPHAGSGPPRHLLMLLPLAMLMALCTYFLAWGITRRLEALRNGVEDLGSGDLSARVDVHGTDEVADLARSFNRAADRIEALVTGQQRMLASASHELRSPLARLRLSVELLREADSEKERDTHCAEAVRDVAELDRLVEDLLLVGRLEATDGIAIDPVDLLALAAEEAARVDATVGGSPTVVAGDEALLRLALRNLLENAVHHGEPPVEVHVEVATPKAGTLARVVVTDCGPGVPAGEQQRVFEPFYRPTGQPEGEGGGTGLGLSLVSRVASLHGGRVLCEGDRGGRFVMEIPVPMDSPGDRGGL